jgi:hypothetical protein
MIRRQIAGIAATGMVLALGAAGASLAAPTTPPAPEIFGPGVISGPASDGAPTFTPDGRTVYFERSNGRWTVIMVSHRGAKGWATPQIASFVDPGATDQQPALSPDGKTLVYASVRRVVVDGKPKGIGHLWRVTRTAKGWSAPQELPPQINMSGLVFKPGLAANGDLYFMADPRTEATGGPKWRLYRSRLVGGVYQTAEPLSFSDGTYGDVDPGVAPDQSFLVFSSQGRKPMDDGHEHLFIVFRKGDGWGPVTPLRYDGDNWGADDGEAQVGPGGTRLYFVSGRQPPFDRKRTAAQMRADYRRMELWDNSNNNAWSLPLAPYLAAREKPLKD